MKEFRTQREKYVLRSRKLLILYILLIVLIGVFLFKMHWISESEREMPSSNTVINDRSLRGKIYSQDKFIISSSSKRYEASVRAPSIIPEKKQLFIELFSIYSGIDPGTIEEKFFDRGGKPKSNIVVLSRDIDAKHAVGLENLSQKLRNLGVFRHLKSGVLYALDIIESGEVRNFPLDDCLTPVVGYVKDTIEDRYLYSVGMNGLEKYAQRHLSTRKDGITEGERDAVGSIIRNANTVKTLRSDGLDMYLNIPLRLQRSVEKRLDIMREETGAQEIIAAIMESETGKVLSIASTKRYNPNKITPQDMEALNGKFATYPHEPGSVLKPVTMGIALDHGVVSPQTIIPTFNGRLNISARHAITDDDPFPQLSCAEIIIHSSNVGISQVSWKLTGKEFRDGLLRFGFSKPSGIDLARELPGKIKSVKLLNSKMHRANQSYGYGLHATFIQLFKAYSAFNNGGMAMTPRIIDYFQDEKGMRYRLDPPEPDLRAISPKAAEQMHEILIRVVQEGTGVAAKYMGLEVGGKTGTAHIAAAGGYSNQYHSSFYGFVNDKSGHKYTVGVLVIRPDKSKRGHFASQTAVPTFKKLVDALVELDYLKPEYTREEQEIIAAKIKKEREKETPYIQYTQPSTVERSYTPARKQPTPTYSRPKAQPTPTAPAAPVRAPKPSPRSEELFNDLDMF